MPDSRAQARRERQTSFPEAAGSPVRTLVIPAVGLHPGKLPDAGGQYRIPRIRRLGKRECFVNLATRQMIAAEDDGWNGRPRTDIGELRVACVGLRVSADGPVRNGQCPARAPGQWTFCNCLFHVRDRFAPSGCVREVEIRSCRADVVRWDLLCERQAESAIRLGAVIPPRRRENAFCGLRCSGSVAISRVVPSGHIAAARLMCQALGPPGHFRITNRVIASSISGDSVSSFDKGVGNFTVSVVASSASPSLWKYRRTRSRSI